MKYLNLSIQNCILGTAFKIMKKEKWFKILQLICSNFDIFPISPI